MISKKDLDPIFIAWYDHKMEPGDPEALRLHHNTIDSIKYKLEELSGQHLSRADVRHALRERFGKWMKENKLPPIYRHNT